MYINERLIGKIESKRLFPLYENDKETICLSWGSHNNFIIHDETSGFDRAFVDFEDQHFQEIIDSYNKATKPSGRTPFWQGVVKAKMLRLETLIDAYAFSKNHIKLIVSSCGGSLNVPHYHEQVVLEIEAFKKLADMANDYKKESNT